MNQEQQGVKDGALFEFTISLNELSIKSTINKSAWANRFMQCNFSLERVLIHMNSQPRARYFSALSKVMINLVQERGMALALLKKAALLCKHFACINRQGWQLQSAFSWLSKQWHDICLNFQINTTFLPENSRSAHHETG